VEEVEECVGSFVVACSFISVIENFEWAFAGQYGPNDDVKRKCLWDELVGATVVCWWCFYCRLAPL
jgi:hypothetical protein